MYENKHKEACVYNTKELKRLDRTLENTGEKNAPPPPSKPDTGKKKRRENRYDFIVEGRIRRSRGKKRINKNETGGEEEVKIEKCYMKKLIKKLFLHSAR